MQRFLSAIVLGLAPTGGIAYAQQQQQADPPTPAQVQRAIQEHRLINGMTLKEANQAMPVRGQMIRQQGQIVGATWKYQSGTEGQVRRTTRRRGQQEADGKAITYIVWSASFDENGLLYGVRHERVTEKPARR